MEIKKHFCAASEAIREGAKLSQQGFKYYFGELGGLEACAYGAAMEAIFGSEARQTDWDNQLENLYPYLTEIAPPCPECGSQGWGLITILKPNGAEIRDLIYHLNDDHRWTRERIADWLYAEEEKLGYVTLENVPETQVTRESRDSVAAPLQASVLT